ncbi:MAG: enoyl-CoA hydratase/isomerase family protein [Myxococcota bacterium]
MEYRNILYESVEGIATITLNRPDVLNAYNPEMGDEVVHALSQVRDDPRVRVLMITGAGRGFCAGVDLKYMKEQEARRARGESVRAIGEEDFVRHMPLELSVFPKPVLVAFNGAAIGVGVTLSLPCDIRIAAESARFGLTFTRLGMLPGLGSTHLLPRIVGLGKALELVLTARVIDAREALEIGLVSRVFADDALLPEARTMAAAIAEGSPGALAGAKRALHYGATATLEAAIKNEADTSAQLRRGDR